MPQAQAVSLASHSGCPDFIVGHSAGRFVVDKAAQRGVFFKYVDFFPWLYHSTKFHTHLHLHVTLLPEGQTGEPGNVLECLRKSGDIG